MYGTKCIKLGRVITYTEGLLSPKSHDCLITWLHEVIWGGGTYYRHYIYTLSTQKARGPYNRTVRMRSEWAILHWFIPFASFLLKKKNILFTWVWKQEFECFIWNVLLRGIMLINLFELSIQIIWMKLSKHTERIIP